MDITQSTPNWQRAPSNPVSRRSRQEWQVHFSIVRRCILILSSARRARRDSLWRHRPALPCCRCLRCEQACGRRAAATAVCACRLRASRAASTRCRPQLKRSHETFALSSAKLISKLPARQTALKLDLHPPLHDDRVPPILRPVRGRSCDSNQLSHFTLMV